MSKKFKGKICVYCTERLSTNTGDHIFAREFFLTKDRANLPKVPACAECNNIKSQLEHYFTVLLPFGGRHETAKENLETMVPKRLEKNPKLHQLLARRMTNVWSNENEGLYVPTIAFPSDPDRFMDLFRLITRGLVWYHWNTYLKKEHFIEVMALTRYGEKFFDQTFLNLEPCNRVVANLGNGTFSYQGIQGIDCPQITIWQFSIFGGAVFGGDLKIPNETSSRIGVLTGPIKTLQNSKLQVKFGVGV